MSEQHTYMGETITRENEARLRSTPAGTMSRDEALEQVSDHNRAWLDRALKVLPYMKREHEVATGEGMRVWLRANGLEEPQHPNAWGALTMAAVRRGLIADTGRVVKMTLNDKSHGRRTPVWRFV